MNLHDALIRAGIRPFEDRTCYQNNAAASLTMGSRSHYYDESTMRGFRCRVSTVRVMADGIVMATIATQARGFHNSDGRGYVVRFHRCDGRALNRDTVYHDTLAQARKEWDAIVASLDVSSIVRDMIEDTRHNAERTIAGCAEAVAMLARGDA